MRKNSKTCSWRGIALGTSTHWELSSWKATLSVLLNTTLNVCQPCALAAKEDNSVRGCIRQCCLMRPLLECWVHFYALEYKKDIDTLEIV